MASSTSQPFSQPAALEMSDALRRLQEQNRRLVQAGTSALVREQQRQVLELRQAIRRPITEMIDANQRAIRAMTRSPFLELAERTRRQHQMMFGPLQQLTQASPVMAMLAGTRRHTAFERTLFHASSPRYDIFSAVLESRRQMVAANFLALSAARTSSRSLASLTLSSQLLDVQRQLRDSLRWSGWLPDAWPTGEPATDGPPLELDWDSTTGQALRDFRASIPRQEIEWLVVYELLSWMGLEIAAPYLSDSTRAEIDRAHYILLVLALVALSVRKDD